MPNKSKKISELTVEEFELLMQSIFKKHFSFKIDLSDLKEKIKKKYEPTPQVSVLAQ